MRKISVVDEQGNLQEIDAGISAYSELQDAPIKTTYNNIPLVGSTVKFEGGKLVLTAEPGHLWSVADTTAQDSELLTFCKHAESGRYDIVSADAGTEILLIDKTNESLGDRYRRITVDQDMVYDAESKSWISISDTSAKELVFKIQNLNELPPKVVVGNSVVLQCYYYSTQGEGFLRITKGEKLVAAYNLESGKTIDVNLTLDIEDGTNNFRFEASNSSDRKVVQTIGINAVKITYVPTFNELAARHNEVSFPFSFGGDGEKYLKFIVTNSKGEENIIDVPNPYLGSGNSSFVLTSKYFSHGENTIETYMYMKDGDYILTRTDSKFFHFPYISEDKPVVLTYYNYEDLREWDTVAIPYIIWSDSVDANSATDIKFELTYVQEKDGVPQPPVVMKQEYSSTVPGNTANYLTFNTEHKWQLTNVPHGDLTFRIYLNKETEPIFVKEHVQVAESDYNFDTIPGYLYNFAANDITGTDRFDDWESQGYHMILTDFNWQNDGIVTEENKSLKFSPASQATLIGPKLFGMVNESGFTLEFDFEVDETAIDSEPVIIYHEKGTNNKKGIFIYPTHAVMNYNDSDLNDEQVTVDYQKGERKNITFVLQPAKGNAKAYLMIYIDGIVSKVMHYSSTQDLVVKCNEFIFNASDNMFRLYATRAYAGPQVSSQVTQNYISNFASAETKGQMLVQNNIYDEERNLQYNQKDVGIKELIGEKYVSLKKVKDSGLIGSMVIIMDALPEQKKPYLKCHTIFYEKDTAHPEVQWDSENNRSMATTYYFVDAPTEEDPHHQELNKQIKVGAQGTSSLRYPRKNFKFKFNDKFYIKGHDFGKDKTFTFKIDYMDSSGANNITNAQIMQNGLIKEDWPGTPVQEGARLNLDGFPVLIFWANYVEDGIPYMRTQIGVNENNEPIYKLEEPEYEGIANFNYDKKAKKLLGWDESSFQGFEFRSNTGSVCLQRGIPNMINFEHGSMGYEWRWTYISDIADDFYDGKLDKTMHGGYFDEDGNQYTEKEYLATRWEKESIPLKPYNSYYIHKPDGDYRILKKDAVSPEDMNKAVPVSYLMFDKERKLDIFGLEYGVRISKAGNLIYQLPYGLTYDTDGKVQNPGSLYLRYIPADNPETPYIIDDLGAYRAIEDLPTNAVGEIDISGNKNDPFGTGEGTHSYTPHFVDPGSIQQYERYAEGYYKYSRNPEHCMYFEYNDTEEYFMNEENWTTVCPISELIGQKVEFKPNPEAKEPYVLDGDGRHHLLANYTPRETDGFINIGEDKWEDPKTLEKFEKVVTYTPITQDDKILTFDFMREIYKYWYYAVDTLSHCNSKNFRDLIDSNRTYSDSLGDNGNGLFIYSALLDYYCLSLFTGLCDNFAKNTFVHSYDGGKTWSHAWYDMDTCFGLNNSGAYVYNYDIDFMDPATFNGSNSTLWRYLYLTCMDDIKHKYWQMRDLSKATYEAGGISYDKVMKVVYDANIKYKTEAMYNSSAMWRYIVPDLEGHAGTELPAAQGSRLSLLKYWNKNRQTFLDSRYGSQDYSKDTIVLRMFADQDINWHYVPDTNMYLGFSVDAADASMPTFRSGKVLANTPWNYTFSITEPLNDKNTYIYGASHLLDVGDLSQTVSKAINLTPAHNLKRIMIGTDDPRILARQEILKDQKMVITLPAAVCKNLTEIDLHNCKYARIGNDSGTILDLSEIAPSLKKVNIKGTTLNSVVVSSFCPLEYLGYSDFITKIEIVNLLQLKDIDFGRTDYVESIHLQNTPMLRQMSVVEKFMNRMIKLDVDNLTCTFEEAVTTDFMEWLVSINAVITGGHIFVQNIADSNLNKYRERWPNLTIELHQIFEDNVIFGATGYNLADPKVTAILGSKNKVAEIAYLKNNIAVRNDYDLDSIPFSELKVVYDYAADGHTVLNKWVRIPKYYSYFDGIETKVSLYKINDDWVLNPKFIAPNGTERAYIDVSAYPCSLINDGKVGELAVSRSGLPAANNLYIDRMRDAVNANNVKEGKYDYGVMDYWTYMMLQDLFSIEFANKNSNDVVTGYEGGGNIKNALINGSMDELIASTGAETNYAESKKHSSMIYRGFENLYGIAQFVDGILIKNGEIFYSTDHAKIAKEGNSVITEATNITLPDYGHIQQLAMDKKSKIRYPSVTDPNGEGYYVDSLAIDKSGIRCVYMGAQGIYTTFADNSASGRNSEGYFRMIRTPKSN